MRWRVIDIDGPVDAGHARIRDADRPTQGDFVEVADVVYEVLGVVLRDERREDGILVVRRSIAMTGRAADDGGDG